MRARGRHVKPSRLKKIAGTTILSSAVVVPLSALTAAPAAAHQVSAPRAAPVATATPAAAPDRATLRVGDRGAAVVDLQRRLGGIAADGVFGPATRRAVVGFQSARGLAADGIVGPRTWGALTGGAPAVQATSTRVAASAPVASSVGSAAVAEASRHAGKPYAYGATGPDAFDCSGFVQYVYGRVGVSLPRTSREQAAAARPVARGSEQLGDLIIFRSGGTVTHLGIYAGDGTMWVARRTGTTVTRQAIYSSSYTVGRPA